MVTSSYKLRKYKRWTCQKYFKVSINYFKNYIKLLAEECKRDECVEKYLISIKEK